MGSPSRDGVTTGPFLRKDLERYQPKPVEETDEDEHDPALD